MINLGSGFAVPKTGLQKYSRIESFHQGSVIIEWSLFQL